MTPRVALHQTLALRTKTGIGHYIAELLDAFAQRPGTTVSGVPGGFMAGAYRRVAPLVGSPRKGSVGAPSIVSRVKSMFRGGFESAQQAYFRSVSRQLTSERFDVYHEPNFPILPTDLPTVLTLCDLSLLLHPEHHPADRVKAFETQLPHALAQTSHIVTISHFIRSEIIRVLGWPADKVTCAYLGVRPTLKPLPPSATRKALVELGLPANYLLYVGTLEPRKNLLMLMRAYCRLPAALREKCPLLLVGGWGWNFQAIADYYETHARHNGVMHLGYLPEERLCALYNGARALVYPSLYEGFGLPPLEMMGCGGATLVSNAGALQEVFGKHTHVIDADDEDSWSVAMSRIVRDDGWLRELQSDVLVHAGRFTWARCAEQTSEVYRRVVGVPQIQRRAA